MIGQNMRVLRSFGTGWIVLITDFPIKSGEIAFLRDLCSVNCLKTKREEAKHESEWLNSLTLWLVRV
jgi:hypothetical protein